ncbi:hypothetical protein CDL12_13745 [Handroanthus impetiginosus]|uniref:Uncharacterized protein n=1 Tax=Handroanthus impetiginosus TaxID=429701 RepID=A0A2G9H7Z7_9LAMI|nr:hypothetical protein CDL12_13745 [Handroanthus impetiginosus]
MVGAPVSYSGNQPQPPSATGTNYSNTPPQQMYATPSAPISTLLPYNGQAPPQPATAPATPYPATSPAPLNMPTSSAPLNASYLYPPNQTSPFPPNPPTSAPYPVSSAAPPPPFPPCSTAPPPPFPPYSTAPTNSYPPASSAPGVYPPNSGLNQTPGAYPPAGYPPQPSNPQPPSGYPTVFIARLFVHGNEKHMMSKTFILHLRVELIFSTPIIFYDYDQVDRTRDLQIFSLTLSQLSYPRKPSMHQPGIEPGSVPWQDSFK